MVKKSKILKKLLASPNNVRFEEFITLIEAFGFVLERVSGSHHIFSHPEIAQIISIQSHQNGQAKPYHEKRRKAPGFSYGDIRRKTLAAEEYLY